VSLFILPLSAQAPPPAQATPPAVQPVAEPEGWVALEPGQGLSGREDRPRRVTMDFSVLFWERDVQHGSEAGRIVVVKEL